MRHLLSRAAVVSGGAALVLVGVVPGTASAATSASCPATGSTRLVTGDVLGDPGTFTTLWVYSPSTSQTIVCFQLPEVDGRLLAQGALVINANASLTPPTVTPGTDPAACTVELADFQDPVPVRIALGASGTTACFTVNNTTTSVTLGLGGIGTVPSVELWRDGVETWLGYAFFCGPIYVYEYNVANNPYAISNYWNCMRSNQRIV